MSFKLTDTAIGFPALDSVSLVQQAPLGVEVRGTDGDRVVPRGGVFVYGKSVDAILLGSLCDANAGVAGMVLAPATAGVGMVGVAMAALPTGNFGWFQVEGVAAVKAPNAMTVGADVFMLAGTPGSVDDAPVAGEQVLNAEVVTTTGTPSTGLAEILINRPFHQGQIT